MAPFICIVRVACCQGMLHKMAPPSDRPCCGVCGPLSSQGTCHSNCKVNPGEPSFSFRIFPYIVHYPTLPLETNVVVPPSLGRRPPLSPTLFYTKVSLITNLLCIDCSLPYSTAHAKPASMYEWQHCGQNDKKRTICKTKKLDCIMKQCTHSNINTERWPQKTVIFVKFYCLWQCTSKRG